MEGRDSRQNVPGRKNKTTEIICMVGTHSQDGQSLNRRVHAVDNPMADREHESHVYTIVLVWRSQHCALTP